MNLIKKVTLLMSSTLFFSSSVFATDYAPQHDSSITFGIFKLIFYLVTFVAIIIFAYFGTRFLAKKSSYLNKTRNIEIIDSINLGSNNRIILVKILEKIYILSNNNNQTTLIDIIEDDTVLISKREEIISPVDFSHYLNKFFSVGNNVKNKVDESKEKSTINSHLYEFKEKMTKLKTELANKSLKNRDENHEENN